MKSSNTFPRRGSQNSTAVASSWPGRLRRPLASSSSCDRSNETLVPTRRTAVVFVVFLLLARAPCLCGFGVVPATKTISSSVGSPPSQRTLQRLLGLTGPATSPTDPSFVSAADCDGISGSNNDPDEEQEDRPFPNIPLNERKLEILQHVVQAQRQQLQDLQQLQQSQQQSFANETFQRQLLQREAEAAARDLFVEWQDEAERQHQRKLEALRDELNATRHSLTKRKGELQRRQLYYESQVAELRQELEQAQASSDADQSALVEARQKHSDDLMRERSAHSEAVRQLKVKVRDQANQLQDLTARRHNLERQIKDLEERHARDRLDWERQLQQVDAEIRDRTSQKSDDNASTERQALQEELQKYREQESEWEERLEIASAAVLAAERREQVLQLRVRSLEEDVAQWQALTAESSERTIVPQLAASHWQEKVDDLEEQIRNLKVAHAAQLRGERKRTRDELEALREQYELEESRARAGAGGSVSARPAAVAADTRAATPPPNAARRLWQRLKRPFQRRAN